MYDCVLTQEEIDALVLGSRGPLTVTPRYWIGDRVVSSTRCGVVRGVDIRPFYLVGDVWMPESELRLEVEQ